MAYTGPIHRATSLDEMGERMQHLGSDEGRAAGLAFQLEPDDVVISPFAKSGTTWLQQTVHGLRTRGDMDFFDISRVVPWLETSTDLGLDLSGPQRGAFRAFKSHLDWHEIPKGGRYIVSIRDPKDVLVSLYRFLEGWWFETGTISITEWAHKRFLANAPDGYWSHLLSWWTQRDNENVLLLSYEEMKTDFRSTVQTIAAFLDIELDEELEQIVLHQSSLDFMLVHKDKFDDLLMRQRSEQVCGLPRGGDSAKVRNGQVGAYLYELPVEVSGEFDRVWQAEITPLLGFSSYDEFRAALIAR